MFVTKVKINFVDNAEEDISDPVHNMYYINDGVHGSFGLRLLGYNASIGQSTLSPLNVSSLSVRVRPFHDFLRFQITCRPTCIYGSHAGDS